MSSTRKCPPRSWTHPLTPHTPLGALTKDNSWSPARVHQRAALEDVSYLSEDQKRTHRGLKLPRKTQNDLGIAREGDWLRVRFSESSGEADEWLEFARGGPVCVVDTWGGGEVAGECFCARHVNGQVVRDSGREAKGKGVQPPPESPAKSEDEIVVQPHNQAFTAAGRPRAIQFEGLSVEIEKEKLLRLDQVTGLPYMAGPILKWAAEQGYTQEKLLRMAGIGQYNTACRWWLKGEKLARGAVLQGAAIMVEWWDAMQENRLRRNVHVDLTNIQDALKMYAWQPKKTEKKVAPPSATASMSKKVRVHEYDAAMLSTPVVSMMTTSSSSSQIVEYLPSRRSGTPGGGDRTGGVKLNPLNGRWESSAFIAPNCPRQKLSLHLSSEEAAASVKKANVAVEALTKLKHENASMSVPDKTCSICAMPLNSSSSRSSSGDAAVATTTPIADPYRGCPLCHRRYHIRCLLNQNDGLLPGMMNEDVPDWACPFCEYDLKKAALLATGSNAIAGLQMPSFSFKKAPPLHTTVDGVMVAALSSSTNRPKLNKPINASSANWTMDDLKFTSTRDNSMEWLSVPFVTSPERLAERRAFFASFRFASAPDTVYRVLDHILIARRCSPIEQPEDLEEEHKHSPDFFVAQIEAMWEDRATGNKFVRIAWFFWREEVDPNIKTYRDVGDGDEVFTSYELDVEPLKRIVAKTRVLPWNEFEEMKKKAAASQAEKLAREVAERAECERIKAEKLAEERRVEAESIAAEKKTLAEKRAEADRLRLEEKAKIWAASANGRRVEDYDVKIHEVSSSMTTAAPVASIALKPNLRACSRCGMWGFRTPGELGAHTGRFCGEDTPDFLQQRRVEFNRAVAVGDEIPLPATKVVHSKRAVAEAAALASKKTAPILPVVPPVSVAVLSTVQRTIVNSPVRGGGVAPARAAVCAVSPSQTRTTGGVPHTSVPREDDEFVSASVMKRALARAKQGPFFARNHYHQKTNRLEVVDVDGSGMSAPQATFLFGTVENPEMELYRAQAQTEAQCFMLGGAFSSMLPKPSLLPKESSSSGGGDSTTTTPATDEVHCSYCWVKLTVFEPIIDCIVCKNLTMCLDCFRLGRQGRPGWSRDGIELDVHLVTHSYRVRPSTVDPRFPRGACDTLKRIATERQLGEPVYELLEVARQAVKSAGGEATAPRPRYRVGVFLVKSRAAIVASEFGFTMEQAREQAAFTWLNVFLGISHAYSVSAISRDWTIWDVSRLMDGLAIHGLAWETVAPIVGTKDATQCRLFFANQLRDYPTPLALATPPPPSNVLISSPTEPILNAIADEAEGWAKRVAAWRRRRSMGKSGLLFAVLKDAVVHVPSQMDGDEERMSICDKCQTSCVDDDARVICSGCGSGFHVSCSEIESTSQESPMDEWYCKNCLDDEKYAYEHSCWGQSGRVLCALADRTNNTVDNNVDSHGDIIMLDDDTEPAAAVAGASTMTAVQNWDFNNTCLENAAEIARMSSDEYTGVDDVDSMNPEDEKSLKKLARKQKKSDREISRTTSALTVASEGGGAPRRTADEYLWSEKNLEQPIIDRLQLANRGLESALAVITQERDELLIKFGGKKAVEEDVVAVAATVPTTSSTIEGEKLV